MLAEVPVGNRSIDQYRQAAGDEQVEKCRKLASSLAGARVLHLNTTAFGGGVAELLYTIVPLTIDLGLHVSWQLWPGGEEFFKVTKLMHNALQGQNLRLTEKMRRIYAEKTAEGAIAFDGEWDFVVVHDPQPAGLLRALRRLGVAPTSKWIWRCHIDLTDAQPQVWQFIQPLVEEFDAAVFTMEDFVKPLNGPHIAIIPPSIDPLSAKNAPIKTATRLEILRRYSVDPNRPMMLQVSRFDPWKDPLGVIDAYRIVKKRRPEVILVMIASMAHDDPEGLHYLQLTQQHRNSDPDIYLLSNLEGVGNLEVNAFQRSASVVVQKSIREGFGLVVAEAMWKGKPVVGGRAGGIRLQVIDGHNGFLVDDVASAADRIDELLGDAQKTRLMGKAARERVRQNFLSTRQLAGELELFQLL